MLEVRQCLEADPALAEEYQARLKLGRETYIMITHQAIMEYRAESRGLPAETITFRVMGVTTEGRKVVARTVWQGKPTGKVLCMKNEWLVVSEQYYGKQAQFFPRSPRFRYYRAS